nr:hypothetical protein [Tanacetum cinerariifolium]
TTGKVKNVNGKEHIQALVDKKKVIITETSVRSDIYLEDAEGTECLPNATIFEQLTLMGNAQHKEIYVTPSHTRKVFANMRIQGKYFSGRVKPLFQSMMVQAPEDIGEGSGIPTDPHHTPIITQPSLAQQKKKQKSRRKQRKEAEVPQHEIQHEVLNLEERRIAQAKEIASLKRESRSWKRE